MSISTDNTASTPDPGVGYLKRFYRHGMLWVLLGLIGLNVYVLATTHPGMDHRYMNLMVSGMLMMNHLAHAYTWKKPADRIVRRVSHIASILVLLYVMNAWYGWL